MDPVTTRKAANMADTGLANGDLSPEKPARSKFDAVRDQTSRQQCNSGTGQNLTNAGPNATSVVSDQHERLKVELRRKLQANSSRKPADVFGDDLKSARNSLNQLKNRVSALPPSSALDQIQKRLSDLDTQFQKAGTAVQSMNGAASPKQLFKLQMDMYQLEENLGTVSKMADQATSGIKSILQTQV